jgi:uncharacterized protein YbjT (DUF2867 family)
MTILVTGATGNIGRRVVDHLIDLGANDIRALTKNPAKANLPDGVTPVIGYLGDPESLRAALVGVNRMYLAPLPQTVNATLELVNAAGVEYVVALSGALTGRSTPTRSPRPAWSTPNSDRRVPRELRHVVGADQGDTYRPRAVPGCGCGADLDG